MNSLMKKMFSSNQWGEPEMVEWTVPKKEEPSKEKLEKLPPPSEAIGYVFSSKWTNEYPTEYGMTAFRRDKILGVSDTSKTILVHMVNGHTFTITIKESVIPFFNRDGLTTTDVLADLKSD